MQWWVGAFNGRTAYAANTTNEPEIVGRVRFYPWRKSKSDWFKQLAFGGSIAHSRSRGLSNDLSFNGTLPDAAYTFFPQFRINGPIERYEGEFTYIKNGFALRGEYVQMQQQRYGVGSETAGGLGFLTLPGIGAKAWNIGSDLSADRRKAAGERHAPGEASAVRPGYSRAERTRLGSLGGWLRATPAFRRTRPAANFLDFYTPGFVPTYDYHTDQFTFGVNWYLNYWVKYQVNVERRSAASSPAPPGSCRRISLW